jgi:hypothetical protein
MRRAGLARACAEEFEVVVRVAQQVQGAEGVAVPQEVLDAFQRKQRTDEVVHCTARGRRGKAWLVARSGSM